MPGAVHPHLPSEPRRRRALLVAASALVAGLVLLPACGGGSDATLDAATPGFDGNGRPVDTRPFEAPGPAVEGSTTLPQGIFDDPRNTTTTTTLPLDTTTTQTTLPLPDVGSPACVALFRYARMIGEIATAEEDPRGYAVTAKTELDGIIGVLAAPGTGTYDAAIALFRSASDRLASATTYQQISDILLPIVTEQEPAIVAAVAPIRAETDRDCPDLATEVVPTT